MRYSDSCPKCGCELEQIRRRLFEKLILVWKSYRCRNCARHWYAWDFLAHRSLTKSLKRQDIVFFLRSFFLDEI